MRKDLLQIVADNPALFDALKSLFEEKFEASFNTRDFPPDTTNEVLGQYIRSKALGLKLVEEAFRDIQQCQSTKEGVDKVNPAY